MGEKGSPHTISSAISFLTVNSRLWNADVSERTARKPYPPSALPRKPFTRFFPGVPFAPTAEHARSSRRLPGPPLEQFPAPGAFRVPRSLRHSSSAIARTVYGAPKRPALIGIHQTRRPWITFRPHTKEHLILWSSPFLCAEFQWEYSEEPLGFAGFKEFPTRYGLNFEALVAGGMPSRRVAAFLQSWLFFGILRETCSRPNYCFDPSDFLRLNEAGERIITTKALLRYLWYWQAARTQDDPDAMAELERTIDKCLGLAHDVLGRINQGIRQRRKSRDSAAFTGLTNCSSCFPFQFLRLPDHGTSELETLHPRASTGMGIPVVGAKHA